jgi:hypothetical protein
MSHFTQLGLSGTPEGKPQGINITNRDQRPALDNTFSGKQKAAAFMGWLMVTLLFGVALLESGGCSKGERRSVSLKSGNPAAYTSQPTPITATTAAEQKPLKKKSRQHKLVASTYMNPVYGVSFRYPKYGDLKEGDHANLQWTELGPVEMNFVETGGTTLAAVELPRSLYPSTDFTSAFFNLSVNSQLTSAQCEQFAFPGQNPSQGHVEGNAENAPAPVATTELSKVKLGSAELTEVEESGSAPANQADAKYYHVYQNGTCYEFALGLETATIAAADGTKPVNRNEVFRKLNWILSTVKITPAGVPATPAEVATHTPTPAPAPGGSKN